MLSQIVRGQHSQYDKVKRNKAWERTKGILKLSPAAGAGIATADTGKKKK